MIYSSSIKLGSIKMASQLSQLSMFSPSVPAAVPATAGLAVERGMNTIAGQIEKMKAFKLNDRNESIVAAVEAVNICRQEISHIRHPTTIEPTVSQSSDEVVTTMSKSA